MKSDPVTNIIIFLCLVFCTAVMAAYPPKVEDDATLYQSIQTKLSEDPTLMGERIGVEPHRGGSELMVEEQAAGK